MSSLLSKIIVSSVADILSTTSKPKDFCKSQTFWLTYGFMCAYDIYDFYKGNMTALKTKDSEGNLVEKKYIVHTMDSVKCYTSYFPLVSYIFYPQDNTSAFALTVCSALEVAHDALNIDSKVTMAYEINGCDIFSLN